MTKFVVVKKGTKSLGMAADYVASTEKNVYSLETIGNHITSRKSHHYHSHKSAYREWLLDQGLCPKYGCVGYAY